MTKEERKKILKDYRYHGVSFEQCKREKDRVGYIREFIRGEFHNVLIRNHPHFEYQYEIVVYNHMLNTVYHSTRPTLERAYISALIYTAKRVSWSHYHDFKIC